MSRFPGLFVELCGDEPSLWQPDNYEGLAAATERIAAAADWPGFRASRVKPLFDAFRACYEYLVRCKGRGADTVWFKKMDAYLGPLRRNGTSGCNTSDVRGVEETVNNMEIDEDVPCDVCRSPHPEDGNEMIFCDSCNVCVHQACYGVRKIPEGNWLCKPCEVNVINPPCLLCPNKRGAMKSTRDGQNWAHVSCALWIKEVKIGIPDLVEPIIISSIPVSRRKLVCSLCRQKTGACIQCVVNHCRVAFHVTCAFEKELKMEYKDVGENAVKLLSYCRKHSRTEKHLKYKKKKKNGGSRKSITTSQGFRPHSQRKSSSETVALFDDESLDTDSTYDSNVQSSGANDFRGIENESDVIDNNSKSDSFSTTQNSVTSRTQIKPNECLTPISSSANSPETFNGSNSEPSKHSSSELSNDTSHDERRSSDSVLETSNDSSDIRSNDSFLETFNDSYSEPSKNSSLEHFINSDHTYSNFKREETEKLSKEEEITHARTQLEPIRRKISGETLSSDMTRFGIVSEEKKDIFCNKNSDEKTLHTRCLLYEQTTFRTQERSSYERSRDSFPEPSNNSLSDPYSDSSLEILYEYSIKGDHACSTPITHKNNCETLASKMVEEIAQSSVNFTTASAQEVPQQCRTELSPENTLRKKIGNSTSSNEFGYLSSNIDHKASCSYDMASTSQQKPQEPSATHPYGAMNRLINKDHHPSSTEDEYERFVASIKNTKRLAEGKKQYRKKRKKAYSTTNSEGSSDASTFDRKENKQILKESIQRDFAEKPFTHPHEALNVLISKDHGASTTDERFDASINNTKRQLSRLAEGKKQYRKKRKRTDVTTNSDDSSAASTSDRTTIKRIQKKSIQTDFAEKSISERNEHYIQFAKVVSTVLKSIPPQIAKKLENKIITLCLESHKQWKQIESKNR